MYIHICIYVYCTGFPCFLRKNVARSALLLHIYTYVFVYVFAARKAPRHPAGVEPVDGSQWISTPAHSIVVQIGK